MSQRIVTGNICFQGWCSIKNHLEPLLCLLVSDWIPLKHLLPSVKKKKKVYMWRIIDWQNSVVEVTNIYMKYRDSCDTEPETTYRMLWSHTTVSQLPFMFNPVTVTLSRMPLICLGGGHLPWTKLSRSLPHPHPCMHACTHTHTSSTPCPAKRVNNTLLVNIHGSMNNIFNMNKR